VEIRPFKGFVFDNKELALFIEYATLFQQFYEAGEKLGLTVDLPPHLHPRLPSLRHPQGVEFNEVCEVHNGLIVIMVAFPNNETWLLGLEVKSKKFRSLALVFETSADVDLFEESGKIAPRFPR
jgi:hypothetical protein